MLELLIGVALYVNGIAITFLLLRRLGEERDGAFEMAAIAWLVVLPIFAVGGIIHLLRLMGKNIQKRKAT